MKLIKEIFNKDLGFVSNKKDRVYNLRRTARVVLVNEQNEIALLNVSNEGYHKLPGGAIEKGESKEEAAKREVEEETGYKIELKEDIGLIIEYSDDTNLMQLSFAYKGKIIEKTQISLSENEINQGIKLEWFTYEEAIRTMKNESPSSYHGKFIVNRDLSFIEESLI
ncbi:NUDIX hydrolase [uncultured Clostridium sp.]|jgi:ADP-ribose pyrophosphatase YjhB (NUDIX family)|uniref:NUDIX domain-containing protein n=1 Tax=uncultured Clostridium sp. TaxID=59620 RepID=UPI002623B230|nr:NUDIX hydrolase [uncultured Clostridium sp.]